MDVADKVVLITGGGGGIGAGIAEAFIEKGAKVAITDINLEYAQMEAERLGHAVIPLQQDVTCKDDWDRVKQSVEQSLGPVDILCNNAGISMPFLPLEELSIDLFEQIMGVNVRGVFLGCQCFIPDMKARRAGHIVNTSSVNGQITHPNFSVYAASKFAVSALSETIHAELAPFGVGVSILYPGLTRSRMSQGQLPDLSPEARERLEALMMDAIWVGRAVVRAVEEEQLHIISHPNHLPQLEARIEELYAAFKNPAQPNYVAGNIPVD